MERIRVADLYAEKPLTHRELRVLRAAAFGYTAAESAPHLLIATETVKTYRQRVLVKLRARNMTQAVAIAYQRGILE